MIAATHQDLRARVADGSFRQDLHYRLAVLPVDLPPLRARAQDIPGLIDHFLEKHSAQQRLPAPRPDAQTLRRACAYAWPGNVRELENVVERAVVLGRFDATSIPETEPAPAPGRPAAPARVAGRVRTLREATAEAEREAVVAALEAAKGNKAEAARLLGVSYKTLFNKIHEHQIREETTIG